MAELEYFTVISDRLSSIEVDYVDLGADPDEDIIYAFVDFVPREKPGTTHWLSGLTPPRGIQLDPIRGRYSPEDGRLRTIIAHPTNEQQLVTVTGTPFTLTYSGQTTANIASGADPGVVEAALEALSNLNPEDVYVYRVAKNEKQTISFSGAPTGGTFALAHPAHPTTFTSAIGRNSNSAYIQQALQNLADIGPVGCSVVGPVGGPWVVEFTGPAAGVNVAMLLANSAGLTPSGTVVITETVAGSSTNPYRVNFVGSLQGTDVPQMTGTNCTIVTGTPGDPAEGVKLVANTPVLELGLDDLIYDVVFTVPDLDPKKVDRLVSPFAIAAPRVGGVSVDLADAEFHLPPKAL
jgi:hypothetical protein